MSRARPFVDGSSVMVIASQSDRPSTSLMHGLKHGNLQMFASCAVNLPNSICGRDVLWFVDNEAAAAAMIRGSSGSRDVDQIVQLAFLQFHLLNTRAWIEWINSSSSPSAGVSRGGLEDEWTCDQGWSLSYARLPSPTICET